MSVSAVVPMRRELKAVAVRHFGTSAGTSFSSCPDEEGTERELKEPLFSPAKLSFSSCPDEEGTERDNPPYEYGRGFGFSSCPDEEGTESHKVAFICFL